MVEIIFAADPITATKVATYLKTGQIQLFYNQTKRMYYVHVVSVQEIYKVASALALYNLVES